MQKTGFTVSFENGETRTKYLTVSDDFDITIKLLKNKKTLVPLGIPPFSGTPENKIIEFEIEISKNGIDEFRVEFLHNDKIIQDFYSHKQTLDEVVVTAKGSGKASSSDTTNDQKAQSGYPKGKYNIEWDGFDSNGIYDSTIFTTGKLKARIKGKLNGKEKSAESGEFVFKYDEVNWVDTKIDKNVKRIDVTLRINLTDGGSRGIKSQNIAGSIKEGIPSRTVYPWDKIPPSEITSSQPVIKSRNVSNNFEALKQLALEDIKKYWERNGNNIGKGVYINEDLYEVFLNCEHNLNGMVAPKIIYFTNSENSTFNRSHNWFGSRKLFYKEGYLKRTNWYYKVTSDAIKDFKETAAHEIGHQLLVQLEGKYHSYTHKGTSHPSIIMQDPVEGTRYPVGGAEIDLMKYADESYPYDYLTRVILSQEDLLGLIWLTKLELNE